MFKLRYNLDSNILLDTVYVSICLCILYIMICDDVVVVVVNMNYCYNPCMLIWYELCVDE